MGIRTPDPPLSRRLLYPAELQVQERHGIPGPDFKGRNAPEKHSFGQLRTAP